MFNTFSNPRSQVSLELRPRVVIGHPYIGRGGSESVVMWLIEALKHDYEVTVMTTGGWELASLNDYYGTQVREEEVKIRIAPVPLLARALSAVALRGACYQRFARRIAPEYDVRISAYNLTDWGLPAIHFIADFSWNQAIREQLDPRSPGFIYRDTILRRAYLRIAATYERPSGRDLLREDLLVANSKWSANLVMQCFGVHCAAVVYPAVWAEFPNVPWEEKEQSFVMIGRIAPEKQIERAIAILEAIQRRGHAIRLHLCGQIEDNFYGRSIMRLCQERADWIILEGRVSGAKKAHILAHCRFGIQTRGSEPFGISVAELVRAGAIVFAPNDGGQAEILQFPDLLFSDHDDAVQKILAAMEHPLLQSALRTQLMDQAKQFAAERFVREVQDFIANVHPFDQACSYRAETHQA